MSRVGKQPVALPAGVTASVKADCVEVQGPKGKLTVPMLAHLEAKVADGQVVISPTLESRQARANWGTQRSLVLNSVVGVTDGWKKNLELQGVGFTAVLNGNVITLATGYSHKTDITVPQGVTADVKKQSIELVSCDRELVGRLAASLRDVCPPEPYLGKGVRYAGENVRRKAGKTGAK